jgi:SHS2 domain-containing protein
VEHTADWELEVWAEDLGGLLAEAARGMYALMGVETSPDDRRHVRLELGADDPEGLLVSFLNELQYLLDSKNLAFDGFLVTVIDGRLDARLEGGPVKTWGKEIKAVTFHELAVRTTGDGLQTRIVFDV